MAGWKTVTKTELSDMAAEFIAQQLELAKSISPLAWLESTNERGQQAFAEAT